MFKISKILNALFFIGVFLAAIYFVYREDLILFIILIFGISLLSYYLIIKTKKYKGVILFLALFTSLYLMNFLFYQSAGNLVLYALLVSQIGYAMFLIESKNGLKAIKFIYIFICLVLVYYISSDMNFENMSEISSANIVNYVFLVFSILLIAVYYKQHAKIIITPAILSVLVSFFSFGRSGMIVSIILLLCIIIIKFKHRMNKFTIGMLLISIPFIGYSVSTYVESLVYNVLYRFGDRETFIKDSPRLDILYDYFNDLDTTKLLFGFDYKVHYFAGFTNLHNSYLDIHYNFGLGGILVLIILLGALIYYFVTRQFFYFTLMITLMLRMVTDTVSLVWVYDFALAYLVLVCVEQLSNQKKTQT